MTDGPREKDLTRPAGRPAKPPRSARADGPPPPSPPDEELLARYVDGDLEAFGRLLERHQKPVFRFIYRYTGDYQRAEDLFQETFYRIVRNATDASRMRSFTAWMYRIARNLAIDAQRRQRYRQAVSLQLDVGAGDAPGTGPTLADVIEGDSPQPSQRMQDEELHVILREAIDRLSPEQREVFLLREQAGLQFKEIAEIVGSPENTVKSRMRYAFDALREHLQRQNVYDTIAAGLALD